MAVKFSQRLAHLSAGDVSAVIQMAWEDRTSFETIQERVGLSESDVIQLMRLELNQSSYRLWRMRMKGRITKHRALRNPEMKFEDRSVANHRRANC
ncbi:TIGR03643 family protein [Limnohabitans sp.]|uniref:TIGR03643 family protein n=1 Tax=Limnohabitans sp. TaxID=1907725 RepID=UPI003342E18F